MSRDVSKLDAYVVADEVIVDVYRVTAGFPTEERFGLQSQIRRAVVSISTNIIEGASRRTEADFIQFLSIALGSANEVRHLLKVARRLDFLTAEQIELVSARVERIPRLLSGLISALERGHAR